MSDNVLDRWGNDGGAQAGVFADGTVRVPSLDVERAGVEAVTTGVIRAGAWWARPSAAWPFVDVAPGSTELTCRLGSTGRVEFWAATGPGAWSAGWQQQMAPRGRREYGLDKPGTYEFVEIQSDCMLMQMIPPFGPRPAPLDCDAVSIYLEHPVPDATQAFRFGIYLIVPPTYTVSSRLAVTAEFVLGSGPAAWYTIPLTAAVEVPADGVVVLVAIAGPADAPARSYAEYSFATTVEAFEGALSVQEWPYDDGLPDDLPEFSSQPLRLPFFIAEAG